MSGRRTPWPILAHVPEEDVERLLAIARRRTFGRGEVVFHADDPADTLHLIVRGRFAARVQTPVGDRVILNVLGPGEMFGELALVREGARRSATIESLDEGETRSIHRPDLDRLRAAHRSVDDAVVEILAARVEHLNGRLLEALYIPADTRVLRRLLELARAADPSGGEARITLRQDDIASIAGTSRATVNRVLRAEQEAGSVRLERGSVTVIDRDALARRAKVAPPRAL